MQDGDTCVENQGVKLLVDPMSVQYLTGAEIDYREGSGGRAVRDPQSQRHHHLRLRFLLHRRLTRRSCVSLGRHRPLSSRPPPDLPRPVPDVLAAVDLGSNSFHMVVARYSHGQLVIIDRLREMVRLAAGRRRERPHRQGRGGARARLPGALRPAPARHARRQRARGGHQRAARRAPQAGVPRARARGARAIPSKSSPAWRRRASSTRASRTRMPSETGQAPGGRHRRRQHRAHHRRRLSRRCELESLQMGCVALERALLPRRQDLRQAHGARAPGRAPGARAGAGGVPPARLGAARPAAPAPCAPSAKRSASSIRRRITITARGPRARCIEYIDRARRTRASSSLEPITEERRPVFPGGLAILAEVFDVLGVEADAHRRRRDARGPAVRHGRPLHATRTRASAPCAPCSSAITSTPRRPSASRPPRCDFLDADARDLEARGSARATWR